MTNPGIQFLKTSQDRLFKLNELLSNSSVDAQAVRAVGTRLFDSATFFTKENTIEKFNKPHNDQEAKLLFYASVLERVSHFYNSSVNTDGAYSFQLKDEIKTWFKEHGLNKIENSSDFIEFFTKSLVNLLLQDITFYYANTDIDFSLNMNKLIQEDQADGKINLNEIITYVTNQSIIIFDNLHKKIEGLNDNVTKALNKLSHNQNCIFNSPKKALSIIRANKKQSILEDVQAQVCSLQSLVDNSNLPPLEKLGTMMSIMDKIHCMLDKNRQERDHFLSLPKQTDTRRTLSV